MTKDIEGGKISSDAESNNLHPPPPSPPAQQQQQQQPQQQQQQQGAASVKEAKNPLNDRVGGEKTNTPSTNDKNHHQSSESVVDLRCHEENLAAWVENGDETTTITTTTPPPTTTIVDRIEYLIDRRENYDPKPLSYYQQLLSDQEKNEEAQEQQKQVDDDEQHDEKDGKAVPATTLTTAEFSKITSTIIAVDDEEDYDEKQQQQQQQMNTMSPSDLLCTEEGLGDETSHNLPDANIIQDFQKKREREKLWSKRYETLKIPRGRPIVWPIEPEFLDGEKFESIFQDIVEDEINQEEKIKEMEQKRNKRRRLQLSDQDKEFLNTNALLLRYSWRNSLNIHPDNPNIGANAYNAILQHQQQEQTSHSQLDNDDTASSSTQQHPQLSRSQIHHIIETLPRPKTIPNPPMIAQFLDEYANSPDVMDYETFVASSSKKQKAKLDDNNDGSNNNNNNNSNNNGNQTMQDAASVAAAIDDEDGRGDDDADDPFQTIGQLYVEFCQQDYSNSEESFKKSTNHWSSEGLQAYMQNLNQQCNELEVRERQVLEKATNVGIANVETWTKAYSHLGIIVPPPSATTKETTSYSAAAAAAAATAVGRPKMG